MKMSMARGVVHMELHTGDLARARAFYERLLACRFEVVGASGRPYLTMDLGGGVGGGIVECGVRPPTWLPYVGVEDIGTATALAADLGAAVLLGPREGAAGWRSVVAEPAGGEIGLWQPKA
jgi:predicted enzyme related to lactoylglutathione lyase